MIDRFNRQFGIRDLWFFRVSYYQHKCKGNLNRDDLPCVFMLNGDIYWNKFNINDVSFHRVDGPARTTIQGDIHYIVKGQLTTKLEAMMYD